MTHEEKALEIIRLIFHGGLSRDKQEAVKQVAAIMASKGKLSFQRKRGICAKARFENTEEYEANRRLSNLREKRYHPKD